MGYNCPMSTLTELEDELAAVKAAIARIREAGQTKQDGSGRQVDEAKYLRLIEEKRDLEHRIAIKKNNGRVPGSGVIFGG